MGGGLAGLSVGYHLERPYQIFERETVVGGTAGTYQDKGFTFDFAGHLLHLHNDYTKKLIRQLLKDNIYECQRQAWIFSHETYTRYPFQANLYGLPEKVIQECYMGLLKAHQKKFTPRPNMPFKEWCLGLFGEGISKHFMFPYNEKLWTVPATEMTADWCGQFVPRPKLEDVLAGSLSDQEKAYGYNTSFLYPKKGGIQVLAQAMVKNKSRVQLGESLERIDWKAKKASFSSGREESYCDLVSCLPLIELLKRLDPLPQELLAAYKKLKWASMLCVNVGVKRAKISEKSWIYFPEKKFPFYRVGFPMNFTPYVVPQGCSSMYVEVAHQPHQKLDQDKVFKEVHKGLIDAGILKESDELPVVRFLDIHYAYVIYDKHRDASLEKIFNWLKKNSISSIGRYGAWKYSFMEEAILDGKACAESLDKQA